MEYITQPTFWGWFGFSFLPPFFGWSALRSLKKTLKYRKELIVLKRIVGIDESDEDVPLHVAAGIKLERFAEKKTKALRLSKNAFAISQAERLVKTGDDTTVLKFFKKTILFGVVGLILGLAFFGFGGLIVGGLAFFTPSFLVSRKIAAREKKFDELMPQAMEMVAMYLKAGQSLPQAIGAMARETPEPIRTEFTLAVDEYNAGRSMTDALQQILQRFPNSHSLRYFVMAISVLDNAGGNILDVIATIKQTTEAKMKFELKLKALTAQSRASGKIMIFLPWCFALGISLIQEGYMTRLFESMTGYVILGACSVLWLVGVIWIRKLVNTTVEG